MKAIRLDTLFWPAAFLSAAVAAQAADLPARKAAPVEYVRVCDAFGQGFFYIPGTDTRLHVGGAMRAEFSVRGDAPTDNLYAASRNLSGSVFTRDLTAFRARPYLNADARTRTAYGAVRTFVSYRITTETSVPGPSGGGNFTPAGATFSQKTSAFQGFNGRSYAILGKGFMERDGRLA